MPRGDTVFLLSFSQEYVRRFIAFAELAASNKPSFARLLWSFSEVEGVSALQDGTEGL